VLLRKEQESADKILAVTQQRKRKTLIARRRDQGQLTKARVGAARLQLEGREDELEVVLRGQTGLEENTLIEVTPEDLPGVAEQEGANLVALALAGQCGAARRRNRRPRQGISTDR